MKELLKTLTIIFTILAAITALLFGGVAFIHRQNIKVEPPVLSLRGWGILLMLLAVILSVALPILLRTTFHSKAAREKKASFSSYSKLQKIIVAVSFAGAFFACLAYLFVTPKLHLYVAVLSGLYGIYGAIPARKKISGELAYYGLKGKE